MKKVFVYLSALAVLAISLSSCDLSDSEKNATLQVWLTDAPGDFQEVNVDIQDLQVHAADDNSESGWKSVGIHKGVYNFLDLTNGLDTLLGGIQLPAGKISQIRLVLGDNNTIKTGDKIYNLETPSAQQSGLKIQVDATLDAGIGYKILLDFDAARSVVQTGNGKFILKPVIRSITMALNGAIKGLVNPKESHPAIFALDNLNHSDTIASCFADTTGHFFMGGLAAGSYYLVFSPDSTYQTVEKENVSVTLGEITDAGTIDIPKKQIIEFLPSPVCIPAGEVFPNSF